MILAEHDNLDRRLSYFHPGAPRGICPRVEHFSVVMIAFVVGRRLSPNDMIWRNDVAGQPFTRSSSS